MAESFEAQVQLEFDDLEKITAKLRESISSAFDGGLKMTKAMEEKFGIMKTRAAELKKLMASAESEADFKTARDAMQVLNRDATRLTNQLLRTKNVPVLEAAKIRSAAREMNVLARSQENMANASIKTSLASQNVVRIIQDAPFGMMGIANNIEQMSESLGRMIKQTGSVGTALKHTFMPLITGPMALPFLISLMTAFTLSWDKLSGTIDKAKVSLGYMTEAQADYNKAAKDIENNALKRAIDQIPWDELGLRIEDAKERLKAANADMVKEQEEFAKKFGFSVKEAQRAQELVANEALLKNGGADAQAAIDALNITTEMRNMAAAADEGEKSLKTVSDRIELISEGLERMQDESQLAFRTQQILGAVGIDMFSDDSSGAGGGSKSVKDAESKKQQLIIDAMQDGLAKRIAQIKLNGKIERKEIAKSFKENSEMLALSVKKEEALIGAERADFVSGMEELAVDAKLAAVKKGYEREVAKIKTDAAERRKVVKAEFNNDADLLALITSSETAALQQAQEKRSKALQAANDKDQAAKAKAHVEAQNRLKKEIASDTKILTFGVQEQAMKLRQTFTDEDPWKVQADEVKLQGDQRLSMIRVREMEINRLVDEGLMNKKLANAELMRLGAEEVDIESKTAQRVKAIHEAKKQAMLGVSQSILGNMGQFFGDMNTLTAKEGEKGLEETKKFLFAQAVTEAIAAGISAYQGWMSTKGMPMPLRMAAAASSMGMITARLMASARRIKQIGKNSAGASAISGGFTQLNSAVTGGRINAYEQQQRRDITRTDNSEIVGSLNSLGERVDAVASRPVNVQSAKIVYDDRTAGDILSKGSEFNQRHTSKISGATVG